jgi:hypothetical protein
MSTPNTNPLTYNAYVTQIGTMAIVNTQTVGGIVSGVDPAFNAIIPQMLNYAELRIQRDVDLLPLQTSLSYSLTAGNNILAISVNDFVTVQTVSVVNGTQSVPLLPVSKEFIQNVWNDSSVTGTPTVFAMLGGDQATGGNTTNNIMVGSTPDQNYSTSIFGTIRMPSLYLNSANSTTASTNTTFISTYLPDMLVMASMIYISAYQRNFGRLNDDPTMAVTYESQYEALLKGALTEEARKRFAAGAWSSMGPTTIATPTR